MILSLGEEDKMIKCTKCNSENVELEEEFNNGKGKIEKVICLDCGFDENPKVFSGVSGIHGAMVVD